jgi:hypothetical protein
MPPGQRLIAGLLAAAMPVVAGAAEPSHCSADESVVFSCLLRNAKVVSLCSSRVLAKDAGYLQYRYGPQGRVELEYPADRAATQTGFTLEQHRPYRMESELLHFTIGQYEYSVYRVVSADRETPNGAGVMVSTPAAAGKAARFTDIKCRKSLFAQGFGLEGVVRADGE